MRNVALIILDGWGLGEERENNAIHVAHTPFFDHLWNNYPHTALQASGEYVGLPEGQIGGSEVGHMTIGAGRVIYQELVRINRSLAIPDSEEYIMDKPTFREFIEKAKTKRAHLVGLVSNGGVHSHQQHLYSLLSLMKQSGCVEPVIHFISDGRDTPPTSGAEFARELLAKIDELGYGKVVTLSGRFYAMDRDKNMNRTERGIDIIMKGKSSSPLQEKLAGTWQENLINGIELSYAASVSDEFIEPLLLDLEYSGANSEDVFYFFNFRSDRMKQLITEINREIPTEQIYTMTQYDKDYSFPIVFSKQEKTGTVGELLSKQNMKQARVAESEKYPHVTYFFNGGVEVVYDGEIRRGVDSNKVTHDQLPEMKATEIAQQVREVVEEELPHFILVNFANPDMVGHTGKFDAVVAGVERVDQELKSICEFLTSRGYICLITADHGNADIMYDLETHELHTAHTLNPVPFIVYDTNDPKNKELVLDQHPANGLHMIAGTMLELMGVHDPNVVYESLIIK